MDFDQTLGSDKQVIPEASAYCDNNYLPVVT